MDSDSGFSRHHQKDNSAIIKRNVRTGSTFKKASCNDIFLYSPNLTQLNLCSFHYYFAYASLKKILVLIPL